MAAHIALASSDDEIRDCLASFTRDVERSLVAIYHCFQENYGDRAAQSATEAWLRILEERLEGTGGLPELTGITTAAIALSGISLLSPSANHRHPRDLLIQKSNFTL